MNLPLLKAKSSNPSMPKPYIDRNPPPLFSNLQVSGTNRFSKAELAIWNLSQPSIQLDEYGHYVYESFTPPKASQTKFAEASNDNKINKAKGCFVVNRKLKTESKILHRALKKREVTAAKEVDKENMKPTFSSPKANLKLFKRYQTEVSSIYKVQSSEKSERKFTFDAPVVKHLEPKQNESSFEVPTNPLVEKVYQQLLALNSETKKRIENYQASLFLSPKMKELQTAQTEREIIIDTETASEKFKEPKDYLKAQAFPFEAELSNDDGNYLSMSAALTPVKQNFKEGGTFYNKDQLLTPQKKALSFKHKDRKDRECFALPKLDLLKENSSKLVKEEMYQTFSEPVFGRKLKLNRHRKNKSSIISGEDLNKMTAFSDIALDEQRMSLLMTSTENTLLQKKTLFATPNLKKSDSKSAVPAEPIAQKFEENEPEVALVVRKPTVERFADLHKAPTRLFNINMKLFLRPITNLFEKESSVVSS